MNFVYVPPKPHKTECPLEDPSLKGRAPILKMKRVNKKPSPAKMKELTSVQHKRTTRDVFHERRMKLILPDEFEPLEETIFPLKDSECEVEEEKDQRT